MAKTKTVAQLQKENEVLKASLEKAQTTGVVSKPVEGTFTVKMEDAEGNETSVEWGFKAGIGRVALTEGAQVSSEALMRIANGGKATDEEKQQYLALENITQAQAQARLEYLAQLGAAFLEER